MNVVMQRQELLIEDLSGLDQREKYQAIIDIGTDLPPFPEEFRISENVVKGCLNKVYLGSRFADGKMLFYGDSDSLIVKGLVAILIRCYGDATPDDILNAPAEFIERLGLNKSLTANRKNGLSSILVKIKQESLQQLIGACS